MQLEIKLDWSTKTGVRTSNGGSSTPEWPLTVTTMLQKALFATVDNQSSASIWTCLLCTQVFPLFEKSPFVYVWWEPSQSSAHQCLAESVFLGRWTHVAGRRGILMIESAGLCSGHYSFRIKWKLFSGVLFWAPWAVLVTKQARRSWTAFHL